MTTASDQKRAVRAIEDHGALLVFPLRDKADPKSLFSVLHPRAKFRWVWDDSADDRVVALWHLRERLARSKHVVYSKWLGGRATFFSKTLFGSMLAVLRGETNPLGGLPRASRTLFDLLMDDSPQPTKRLREAAGLGGRTLEGEYNRAMRVLWDRLLVVGAGEAEEGGFPSLTVGATELLFEPLWRGSESCSEAHRAAVTRQMDASPAFARAWRRVLRASSSSPIDETDPFAGLEPL